MISPDGDFFRDQGYLRLEGFHQETRLAPLRKTLRDALEPLARRKGFAASLRALPLFQGIGKLSSTVKVPGLHEALVTPELIDRITRLGGRAPSAIQETRLLLSPPSQGRWTLEGLDWHVDVGTKSPDRLPGIQAFFLIDDVAPQGGATLALAGSHRISPGIAASRLRNALHAPAEEMERHLRELGVTLVEMSGQVGDVYLMDMRLLHTPSVNATRRFRMMATSRCLLDS